jgi:hypothetical protein
MSSLVLAGDVTLGGVWVVRKGGVRRFVPADQLPPAVQPPVKTYDLTKLIACPTCRATVTQTCKTRSGHTTTPHGSRLAPRLCACGLIPDPGHTLCRFCAAESLQRSKNEHGARRRARAA